MILILSEIGLSQENEFRMVDVLDNPLISKMAQVIEDGLSHLNEIGVDFKGKNLVSLRYNMHDTPDEMLTYCWSNEYDKVADIMRKRDIELRPEIQTIIDQRDDGLKREADLQKKLEKALEQIKERDKKIERQNNEKGRDAYIQRAFKRSQRKKKY